jgi:hypothetical protein
MMRKFSTLLLIAAFVLSITSCGDSKEEQAAKDVAKQAAEPEGGVTEMAKDMEEVAKGMQDMAKQMTGQGGDNHAPVEPVSFRELYTVMPELGGWEKGKPTGEKMTAPIAMSQADVTYTKGEARITLKVVDSGFSQLFFMPYAMMMAAGYEKETSEGFEKSTMIGTYPGFEKRDDTSKRGELAVAVNKRFFVTIEGDNIQDNTVLHELMSKMDLGKLAGMK